jgi:lipopolysaccharide/colanic/teichoic acid biosynthesis glycosyltransferase
LDKKEALTMNWRVIVNPEVKPTSKSTYPFIRRILEVIICLLAIPFVIPLGIIIAIAIRLDSSGPVLFLQDRVGKDGKIFKIIKFRTMYHNIDDSSHRAYMKKYISGQMNEVAKSNKTFKPFKSSQVTPVGRILRKTSLDELPQLINVFKNEMSFVGPRPNVIWEVEAYNEWHAERLKVLPGITGLAQVRGRSQITFDDIVRHDLEYIENQSLKLDALILWWTVASVLFSNGAE